MFSELATDQQEKWMFECPDLEDEDLPIRHPSDDTSEISGVCDYRGLDALVLCDSVDALAHDDDGKHQSS